MTSMAFKLQPIKRTGMPVQMNEPAPTSTSWNNLPNMPRTNPVQMQEPAPVPANRKMWNWGAMIPRTNPVRMQEPMPTQGFAPLLAVQNALNKFRR